YLYFMYSDHRHLHSFPTRRSSDLFGVNHLPVPEKAFSEANRVLTPGGRFAFSMWCAPGKSRFHQLVLESIRAHGNMDVPLPPAPDRKSTRLNSSHDQISYAVFCLK